MKLWFNLGIVALGWPVLLSLAIDRGSIFGIVVCSTLFLFNIFAAAYCFWKGW